MEVSLDGSKRVLTQRRVTASFRYFHLWGGVLELFVTCAIARGVMCGAACCTFYACMASCSQLAVSIPHNRRLTGRMASPLSHC